MPQPPCIMVLSHNLLRKGLGMVDGVDGALCAHSLLGATNDDINLRLIADEKLACFCLTPLLCWVCLCWAPMVAQPLPFLLLTCGSSVSGHNWPFNFRGRGRWGLCLGKIILGETLSQPPDTGCFFSGTFNLLQLTLFLLLWALCTQFFLSTLRPQCNV